MLHWISNTGAWLAKPTTGGVIGAGSLLLTVAGFTVTIIQVRRSKSAAEAAQASALAVQSQLSRFDVVAECFSAIQALEEIERLHRQGPLHLLPERYNSVRKSLIQVRAMNPAPEEGQMAQLQNAVVQMATLKERVERQLAAGDLTIDAARANRVTSRILQELVEFAATLRKEMGR